MRTWPFDTPRAAWRNLARHPWHTAAVAALLALGLGVVMALAAVADRLILHPAPYPDAGRVVAVYGVIPDYDACQFNATSFNQLEEHLGSFEALAAAAPASLVLGRGAEAAPVPVARVTRHFFQVLGARPLAGRLAFTAGEDVYGGPAAVILTEGAWRARHGADPGLVGRTLDLDGVPRTVVGILPDAVPAPSARLSGVRYYLPAAFTPAERATEGNNFEAFGRVKAGLTLAQVQADLARFAATRTVPGRIGFRAAPVAGELGAVWRDALALFAGAAALVLGLAGASAASLTLARSAGRHGEWAVRAALGAGAARIAGLLFLESAWTALLGFAGAVPLALGLCALLASHLRLDPAPPLDGMAWLIGAAGMGAALLLAAAAPAWAAGRTDPAGALKGGSRTVVPGGRQSLLVVQLALALALLAGSALLARSLARLAGLPTGVRAPEQVLAGTVAFPEGAFATATARTAAFEALRLRLEALPGSGPVALTQTAPFYKVPGYGAWRAADGQTLKVYRHWCAGDVPGALGIPLLAGRMPRPGEPACALSADACARLWPGADPLGRGVPWEHGPLQVVGVLAPVVERDPRHGPQAQVWIPLEPDLPFVDVFVRAEGKPASRVALLRRAVTEAASGAVLERAEPWTASMAEATAPVRRALVLMVALAGLATLLASGGVYGAAVQAALRRQREFGLRMALGDTPNGVALRVLRQTLRLAAFGLPLGLAGAFGLAQALRHWVHGAGTLDLPACLAAALLLLAMVLSASLVPALRTARLDPARTLRGE